MSEDNKAANTASDAVAKAMAAIKAGGPKVELTEQPPAPAAQTAPQKKEDIEETKVPELKPSFSGRAGDTFCIYGPGFGTTVGSVSLGAFQCRLTSWQDHCIKGIVPEALRPGGVELSVNGSTPIAVRLNA